MTLICTRGLPASGKTTWAREQVAAAEPGAVVRLNRDDLRAMMHGKSHLIYATEEQVSLVQHGGIGALLKSGVTVIVDDTNLRARHLRNLAEIAWRNGAEFRVQDFTDVPLEECIARDLVRCGTDRQHVGEDVIRGMHRSYIAGRALPLPVPQLPETVTGAPYLPAVGAPNAVMVDIDGTVALHGDRDPYDTSRYHEDAVNPGVAAMVLAAHQAGHVVLYCSGRDETFRAVTEQWLADHVRVPGELFMRPADDRRRDDVVKLELFDKHIRDAYRVVCVFDDRDRVVRAWRSIGLTVMQVAEGGF